MSTETTPVMITLSLSLEQVNALLNCLNDLPHRVSRGLIDTVYGQAVSQVPQEPAAEQPAAE